MQDEKVAVTIVDLITELRTRIRQLDSVSDEDFLKEVDEIGKWFFSRTEFDDAVDYIDNTLLHQRAIISDIGKELVFELNKECKDLFSYKFNISDLDETEQFYYKELQDAYNENKNLSMQDSYNYFRMVNMGLYRLSAFKKSMEKQKKIKMSSDGLVEDFVPLAIWKAWIEVEKAGDLYRDSREDNVQGTVSHLRQLTLLKEEYEWRNQFKSWREIYGRSYYIPRLYNLSNFIYDFCVLNVKPDFDTGLENKLEVKGVDYEYKESKLLVKPDYGSIAFDPSKSDKKKHFMGYFIKALISNSDGIETSKFCEHEEGLDLGITSTYRTILNGRFKESWENGDLKLFLYIDSVKDDGGKRKYILRAYRFRLDKVGEESNPSS